MLLTRRPALRTASTARARPVSSSLRNDSPTWSMPTRCHKARSSSKLCFHDETALTDSCGCTRVAPSTASEQERACGVAAACRSDRHLRVGLGDLSLATLHPELRARLVQEAV